jgi:D-3-phosphoglycerate dehydrogenase
MKASALCLDKVGEDLVPERTVLGPLGISASWPADSVRSLKSQLQRADAVLVNVTAVNAELFDKCPRCRVVVTYGVGYDHIDLEEARRRGITVAHVPDYCVEEVADHTMALLLSLARKLPLSDQIVRNGQWGIERLVPIRRLTGSTLGVIGFGKTGRAVARRATAFGLNVRAYDPYVSSGDDGVSFARTLVDLLRSADYVTLHVPLEPETTYLLDSERLALMRPGAILINTSRGALVDLTALVRLLDQGALAGAGLDVFPDEPPDLSQISHPKLLLTPHSGFYSTEAMVDLKRSAAQAVAVALTGGSPTNRLV